MWPLIRQNLKPRMKRSKPVIGMIWCDPFSGNLGVCALAYSALFLIGILLEEKGKQASFLLLGPSDSLRQSIEIEGKQIDFDRIPRVGFLTWKGLLQRIIHPVEHRASDILAAKVVFDLSEGDSFTDLYGAGRFRQFLDSKRFFNLLGKTQVMLPQTIGPFKNPEHEQRAFAVMRKMTKVIARDNQSYVYASNGLGGERVEESIDLAFALPFERMRFDDAHVHVGLNVSALLWNGGYTRDNQFHLKADYQALTDRILDYFTSQTEVLVHLIPHVIPDDMPVENDYAVARELQARFPRCVLAPRFRNPIDAKNYISGMDFFVGARMHAAIAAFSSQVPTFPLAYSRKFNGLFGDTLRYPWMGDCVNEDAPPILARLKEAFESRRQLQADIRSIDRSIVGPRLEALKASLSAVLDQAL